MTDVISEQNPKRMNDVISEQNPKQQTNHKTIRTIPKYSGAMAEEINIFDACRAGNLEHLKMLIKQGIDVNVCGKNGWTPLFFAVSEGQLSCAQLLLSQGANPHLQNGNGETALQEASYFDDPACLQLLIRYNADVHHVDKDGMNCLFFVSLNCLKVLLDLGVNVHQVSQLNTNPLALALAFNYNSACVEMFLDMDATLPVPRVSQCKIEGDKHRLAVHAQHARLWDYKTFVRWSVRVRPWMFTVLMASNRFWICLPNEVWTNGILPFIHFRDMLG